MKVSTGSALLFKWNLAWNPLKKKKKNYIHTVLNSCQTIFTPWFYLIFKVSQWSSQDKTDQLFIDNRSLERQWGLLKTDRYWSWNARLLVAKPMFLLSSLAAFLVVSVCRADRAVGCCHSPEQFAFLQCFSWPQGYRSLSTVDVIEVTSFQKCFSSTAFPAALVKVGTASSSYTSKPLYWYYIMIIALGLVSKLQPYIW